MKNLKVSGDMIWIFISSGGRKRGYTGRTASLFEYIWEKYPDTKYISETHGHIFLRKWEEPLMEYLESHDEPLVCSVLWTVEELWRVGKRWPCHYDDYGKFY